MNEPAKRVNAMQALTSTMIQEIIEMADESVTVKTCSACKQTKPVDLFHTKTASKDGKEKRCKACSKEYGAKYYAANAEKIKASVKAYRDADPEKNKARNKAHRAANRDSIRKRDAEYQANNKEKISKRRKIYYVKNKEKIKDYKSAYQIRAAKMLREKQAANYEKNREQRLAKGKEWYRANFDKYLIYRHNRRARKVNNGGKLSPDIAEKLFKLQRGKCACCGKPLGKDYHLDHRIPLSRGGTNDDLNVQLLTQRCNNQKHSKDPIVFMQERGFLI